jgi:hypothetical protein
LGGDTVWRLESQYSRCRSRNSHLEDILQRNPSVDSNFRFVATPSKDLAVIRGRLQPRSEHLACHGPPMAHRCSQPLIFSPFLFLLFLCRISGISSSSSSSLFPTFPSLAIWKYQPPQFIHPRNQWRVICRKMLAGHLEEVTFVTHHSLCMTEPASSARNRNWRWVPN